MWCRMRASGGDLIKTSATEGRKEGRTNEWTDRPTDRQDGWTNRRKEGKNAPTLAETGERLINLEVVDEEEEKGFC